MLGEKLMKLRKRNGMSQQDVAAALSVSRQTISNWESGASAPDIGKAKELATLYRISLDDLVDDAIDVTVAESAGVGAPPDLHVLKSLVGARCRIALASGFWMSGLSGSVEVLEVDDNWVRITHERLFQERAVELVDMKSITGFQIVSPASADKHDDREAGECDGAERMD